MCLVYGPCASLLLGVCATLATTVILQEGGLKEIGFRDQDMAAVEPTQAGARWQGMRLKKARGATNAKPLQLGTRSTAGLMMLWQRDCVKAPC